jgi:hypothetical protein
MEKLALHCPGFASLNTSGAVKLKDAAALARSLPRLFSLSYLLAILSAIRDLQEFISSTPGAASASTIRTRRCSGERPGSSGSTLEGPSWWAS